MVRTVGVFSLCLLAVVVGFTATGCSNEGRGGDKMQEGKMGNTKMQDSKMKEGTTEVSKTKDDRMKDEKK